MDETDCRADQLNKTISFADVKMRAIIENKIIVMQICIIFFFFSLQPITGDCNFRSRTRAHRNVCTEIGSIIPVVDL